MAFVYSCCFWFSLRLAGIIIGTLSMLRGILTLAALGVAQKNEDMVYERLSAWMQETDLSFTQPLFQSILYGLDSYITVLIVLDTIYIVMCVTFVYAAYKCNNYLMLGYLVSELFCLVSVSALVVAWLMVLKKNTMDIGLLIGASITGGFFLLGMFYLWVCTASLPILISEMEREEQLETIQKLQQKLEQRPRNNYSADMDRLVPAFPVEPVVPDIYAADGKSLGFTNGPRSNVNTITGNMNSRGFRIMSREFIQ